MATMDSYTDKKVMVVEDSKMGRVLILKELEKLDLKNITAPESSVEAWEEIAQTTVEGNSFDLIITDLNMPDLDGIDLILNLKSDKLSKKIEIIVISAEADPKIMQKLKDFGVKAYFTKPVRDEDLKKAIEGIFSNSKLDDSYAFKELHLENITSTNSKT